MQPEASGFVDGDAAFRGPPAVLVSLNLRSQGALGSGARIDARFTDEELMESGLAPGQI
jgi:hypothetical protein